MNMLGEQTVVIGGRRSVESEYAAVARHPNRVGVVVVRQHVPEIAMNRGGSRATSAAGGFKEMVPLQLTVLVQCRSGHDVLRRVHQGVHAVSRSKRGRHK
jgi:phosphatidate phosphatase APP1